MKQAVSEEKQSVQPAKGNFEKPAKIGQENHSVKGYGSKPRSRVRCYNCNVIGHYASECRKAKHVAVTQVQQSPDDGSQVGMGLVTISICCLVEETHECKGHAIGMGRLRCPTIGSTKLLVEDSQSMKNLPTARGKLNGNDVTVLRDTGCTGAVVKRSLVEEDQLLNYKCSYISIDRMMKPVQVARVYIVSPIYTGYFEALCVEDPLVTLL